MDFDWHWHSIKIDSARTIAAALLAAANKAEAASE
jgi:hypothetical protein